MSLNHMAFDHMAFGHVVAGPYRSCGVLAELVAEGKVRYIGLSEAGPATIRRAHAVIIEGPPA